MDEFAGVPEKDQPKGGSIEFMKEGEGLAITAPQYIFRTPGPTLSIKTPNGVELCVACNEYAVAEHWVMTDGVSEKRLGRKCLWCGNRSS